LQKEIKPKLLNSFMSEFTFFKGFTLVREAGEPTAPAGGGPPGGDLGGGPPGGGMPPMGGGGGGDPMGGGGGEGGPGGQPIDVKSIPAADVWKMLEKIVQDEKYGKFFEEINIVKKQSPTTYSPKKEKEKKSLMR
jgi:hypothetical protein